MSEFVRAKSSRPTPGYQLLGLIAFALCWAAPCQAQLKGGGGNTVNPSAVLNGLQNRLGGVPAGANVSPAAAGAGQNAMLWRYDLNRDGQLSAQETMYAMQRRGGVQNGYGGMGGQGMAQPMNQQGNQAANNQPAVDPDDAADQARKAKAAAKKKPAKRSLVSKFDKDGDGKLNAEEKAAAKDAISKRQK